MKIKCNDGKIRKFVISKYSKVFCDYTESYCSICTYSFGVHDTSVLKPIWKEHICKEEMIQKYGLKED